MHELPLAVRPGQSSRSISNTGPVAFEDAIGNHGFFPLSLDRKILSILVFLDLLRHQCCWMTLISFPARLPKSELRCIQQGPATDSVSAVVKVRYSVGFEP